MVLLTDWFNVFILYLIDVPDVEVSDTSCAVAILCDPVLPSEPKVIAVHVDPLSALTVWVFP